MDEKSSLIPPRKLLSLLSLIDREEKIDKDALTILSQFSEKFISDIVGKASLVAKHKGKSTITEEEVKFVIEREFDYYISTHR